MPTVNIILAVAVVLSFLAHKYYERKAYKIIIESCKRDLEEMEEMVKIWEAEKKEL